MSIRTPASWACSHLGGGGLDLAAEQVDLADGRPDPVAVVGQVGEEGERGTQRGTVFDDRLQGGLVHERGVEDEVDPGRAAATVD